MAETAYTPIGDAAWADELVKRWTTTLPGDTKPLDIDNGAILSLALYLESHHERAEWRTEAENLIPRIRAVLRHAGADELEALRRARYIAIQATLGAQDERDYREGRETHGRWLNGEQPRQQVVSPAAQKSGPTVVHISRVSSAVIGAAEHQPRVLSTPFPTLNTLLNGGFWPGEYILLGARPSVGKSALATQFALAMAHKAHATLIVSREMKNLAVARRLVAQEGRLDAGALRSGRGVDWTGATHTVARLHDMPIWLTDDASTTDDIAAALDRVGKPVDFCVVDYLQLLHAPRHIREQRLQIEAISKALKQLATSRNLPVLALSSLSRPGAGQEKRPTLASLRDTGSLEHDADVVLLLHRERDSTETECFVAKNRDGRIGTAPLCFRPEWVGFDELTTADPWDEEGRRYGD